MLTHADGGNQALLALYPTSGLDVAESVCPAPGTGCPRAQVRVGMGPAVTVRGGVPSVALLPDSTDTPTLEVCQDRLFDEAGSGVGLVFRVADNVSPDGNPRGLQEVARRARALGPAPGRARPFNPDRCAPRC